MSKKELKISTLKLINLPPIPPKPISNRQGLISTCSYNKKVEELKEENSVLKVQIGQIEHRLSILEDKCRARRLV